MVNDSPLLHRLIVRWFERFYENKNNNWNTRYLVNELFAPSAQQTSVLCCRLTNFNICLAYTQRGSYRHAIAHTFLTDFDNAQLLRWAVMLILYIPGNNPTLKRPHSKMLMVDKLVSMTQLLSHTFAHLTGSSFRLKGKLLPIKNILGVKYSWVNSVKKWPSF